MAERARTYGLPVEVATFEAWDPAGRTFDLIVAGQAWHWIDHQVGPQKAAALLPSAGKLAVFWNRGTHDAEAQTLLNDVYRRYAPTMAAGYAPSGNPQQTTGEDVSAIVATGHFESPELRTYTWAQQYSRDEWLDQLGTHSDHLSLPPGQFQALAEAIAATIDQLGGAITVSFRTELILAAKK